MTSYNEYERRISFYGDKVGVPVGPITTTFCPFLKVAQMRELTPISKMIRHKKIEGFKKHLDEEFTATVTDVIRLTPTIIEVIVRAPMA